MSIEDFIKEIEKIVEDISTERTIELWNDLFEEEHIPLSDVGNYNDEATEDLKCMIVDQLEDLDVEELVNIHDSLTGEKYQDLIVFSGAESTEEDEWEE